MHIGLPNLRLSSSGSLSAAIAALFINNEQGWLYDPSDFSTMFQDSAGTTPVTAVEQPVGKQLDKSGRGNHRIQATAASRPTLSARYNLLTKSGDFSDAAWAKILGASATANVITLTASDGCRIEQVTGVAAVEGQTHSASVTLSGTGTVGLTLNAGGGGGGETEDVVVLTSTPTRYTVTHTFAAGPVGNVRMMIIHRAGYTATEVTATAAQVNPGSTATRYQRVNTSTDYDTDGFLHYLKYDGVDDSLATASTVDFTATDKVTVFAGVTKLSDASDAIIIETGTNAGAVAGSFAVQSGATGNWGFQMFGTARGLYTTAAAAPDTRVFAVSYDIGGASLADEIKPRANGAVPSLTAVVAGPCGTGNFGSYTAYFGRRNNASLPLNGREYANICVGRLANTTEIANVERYVNSRTGAY